MKQRYQPESLSSIEQEDTQARNCEYVNLMAAGLAHDLRNMLQVAGGAIDLMQKRIDQGQAGETYDLSQVASTSLKRSAALIDGFLAFFSRPDAADLRSVSVNDVIASMAGMLKCTLGDQIEVEFALVDGLSRIVCDPRQLENAVLNLAINARDAMPLGGTLAIATYHVDRDEERWIRRQRRCVGIRVADTGIGMAPDVVEHAFDPFHTTKSHGTGLGLAMVKKFVEQLRGNISIESTAGEGTTILLCLPI
jgi:signal transduction histidine kinase